MENIGSSNHLNNSKPNTTLLQKIEQSVVIAKLQEHELAKFINGRVTSKQEDYLEHTDIKVEIGIDLKGIKKIRRSDFEANENYHWVEIKNTAGYDGWLYAGTNKFIAFETKNWYGVVEKTDLAKLISKNLINQTSEVPLIYHLYNRKGRQDSLTLVPTLDLFAIAKQIIPKTKYKY